MAKKKVQAVTEEDIAEGEEQQEVVRKSPATHLFEALKKKGTSINTLVDEWIKNYTKDRKEATVQIINFLIKACGCETGELTVDEYEEDEAQELLNGIITPEYLKEGEMNYPIVARKGTNFASQFAKFWNQIISKSTNKILFDGYFLDSISSWISAFSNALARPFRHTATMAAMEVNSALIKVINERINKDISALDRSISTERRKGASSGSQKMKDLTKKKNRLEQNKQQLQEAMNVLYKGYRDTVPEIRCTCVEALGRWINSYPEFYLDDKLLKYIGWALSDKDARVRILALKVVERLYAQPELADTLEIFISTFENRLIQMVADNEIDVGVEALKVVTLQTKMKELSEEDIQRIYQAITDDHTKIRLEAAKFVKLCYFDKIGDTTGEEGIRSLISFVDKSLAPDVPNYIVDALWPLDIPHLKNWNAMVNVLMDDELSASEQVHAARIFVCCIKKANGAPIYPAPKAEQSKPDKKEKIEKNKNDLTRVLIKQLPELINNFSEEEQVLSELVVIPQYLALDVYSTQRDKEKFSALLKKLTKCYTSHTNEEVLTGIANTLVYLADTEHELKTPAEEILLQLAMDLNKSFETNYKSLEDKDFDRTNLVVAIERIDYLYKCKDLSDSIGIDESLIEIIGDKESLIEDLSSAFSVLNTSMLWSLLKVHKDPSGLELFVRTRDHLGRLLQQHLSVGTPSVRERCFTILCDFLVLFPRKFEKTEMSDLEFQCKSSLEREMREYYVETVAAMEESEDREGITKLTEAYVRPLASGAMSTESVPSVLTHFCQHGKYVETVIKSLLSKLRESNADAEWKFVLATLTEKYEETLKAIEEDEDIGEEEEEKREKVQNHMKGFKELAARLALTYHSNFGKADRSLTDGLRSLVIRAIDTAFKEDEGHDPKRYFSFLGDGVLRLSSRMGQSAASESLRHLEEAEKKRYPDGIEEVEEGEDEPYCRFRAHIKKIALGASAAPSSPKKKAGKKTAGKKTAGKTKRKAKAAKVLDFEEEEEGGEKEKRQSPRKKSRVSYKDDEVESIDSSEEEEAPKKKRGKGDEKKRGKGDEKKRGKKTKEHQSLKKPRYSKKPASLKGRDDSDGESDEDEDVRQLRSELKRG
ncbi:Cohesin subunit SA-1 [Planoprotostelium fungivorum]|uniref:Cohesin subunit SA-1 n=1 Tax=Planoprotostelium fungivorum TaxID=1890364 RepID=A0A2P6MXW1_9EUKA|nr:Cohesin subunit SA-1 [Planoprotostelium fungivorum]